MVILHVLNQEPPVVESEPPAPAQSEETATPATPAESEQPAAESEEPAAPAESEEPAAPAESEEAAESEVATKLLALNSIWKYCSFTWPVIKKNKLF